MNIEDLGVDLYLDFLVPEKTMIMCSESGKYCKLGGYVCNNEKRSNTLQ